MQEYNKKFIFFLLIYTSLSLYTIGYVPIFESTEARYAEISREMIETGNYIEPHFNGIKHFHKPPLTYWMIASGLKLFGINNFGARFFGIIASLLIFIFTIKSAKFFVKKEESYYPAYILGTSILFLTVSRVVATDIYLTLWTIIVQYYYFKQIYEKKDTKNAIMIGVFLGLGFITKGPIIFLFTLLPYLLMKLFDDHFKKVFSIKSILASIVLFIVISLPWYIAVILKNPNLLEYFLKVQTVERVTTNRFNREQPFYFFFNTLFISSLPYSLLVLYKIKTIYLNYKRYIVLSVYIITPFVIFSIAKSKLHSYLTPLTPILSIFLFKIYKEYCSKAFNKIIYLLLTTIPIILIIASFIIDKIRFNPTILILSIVTIIFILLSYNKIESISFAYNIGLITLVLFNILYFSAGIFQEKLMGFEYMVDTANSIDPDRKLESICYKRDLPSTSFYRNKLSVMALGTIRETQFQKDESFKRYYIQSGEEISDFLKNNKQFFLFTRGHEQEFVEKYKVNCENKYTQRDYTLSLCTKKVK